MAEGNVYLEIHQAKCTGCRLCELFCSFHHERAIWPARARLHVEAKSDDGPFTPNVCRQCQDAPCAAVCPVEAMTLDATTGAWVVDGAACIGCGACEDACPYGVIVVDADLETSLKCDFCGGAPECAAICPSGAIVMGMR